MYKKGFKRMIDLILSLILLVVSSPVWMISIFLLFIANQGKIFFVQSRPGKEANIFKLIKFKTMNDRRDNKGELLPDSERLTGIGKLIRKLSIDELPQLINVIKGDMSLIGPRPWLVEYIPLYNDFQRRRHEVLPGITGWAQVNGRNTLSWDQRFEYDIYYVDHVSFRLDFKIFFMTIWNIISGRGISGEGSATMEKFQGNKVKNKNTSDK